MKHSFIFYLLTMALVTYFVRIIPLLLIKKEIKNQFILSFLHYIPYAILTVMTIPDIFYCTDQFISSFCGLIIGLILAYQGKSLLVVSIACSLVVLILTIIF